MPGAEAPQAPAQEQQAAPPPEAAPAPAPPPQQPAPAPEYTPYESAPIAGRLNLHFDTPGGFTAKLEMDVYPSELASETFIQNIDEMLQSWSIKPTPAVLHATYANGNAAPAAAPADGGAAPPPPQAPAAAPAPQPQQPQGQGAGPGCPVHGLENPRWAQRWSTWECKVNTTDPTQTWIKPQPWNGADDGIPRYFCKFRWK